MKVKEVIMEEKLVKIPQLNCEYCSKVIRKTLSAIDGVDHVEVHLDTRAVLIRWSPPASWERISKMLIEIDYPPVGNKNPPGED